MSSANRAGWSGRWKAAIGIAISIAAIAWAARGVDWSAVGPALLGADPVRLAALFVLAPVVNVGARAVRWRILLAPAARVPLARLLEATAVGLMANNVLPARIGELVRAWTLARRGGVTTGAAVGSLFVERVLDGFALVAILYATTRLHPFPEWVDGTARIAFWLFVAFLAVQAWLVFHSGRALAIAAWVSRRILGGRFADPLERAIVGFVDGLQLLRRPHLVLASFALALLQWAAIATLYRIGFDAFDLGHVGWTGAFFVGAVSALGVAVPSSPGFVGTFQAVVVVALEPFGVSRTAAFAFSVGYHIVSWIPVTIVGLVAFARAGLTWGQLEHSAEEIDAEVEEEIEDELGVEIPEDRDA